MAQLFIIGNGFDLAHGIKTSYADFIEDVLENTIQGTGKYPAQFLIKKGATDSRENLMSGLKNNFSETQNQFRSYFFKNIIIDYATKNWCDIEERYFDLLVESKSDEQVLLLNKEFRIIKDMLETYLCSLSYDMKLSDFEHLFKKYSHHALYVNFNYTNTLKNYIENERQILNIHGLLSSEQNPIIFGYSADDKQSRELLNRGHNSYMENLKKHCYKRNSVEQALITFMDRSRTSGNLRAHILGHSCGLSDKNILNKIFNHNNTNSIQIHYYNSYSNYSNTLANIDRIMDNDENFSRILSFDDSTTMPQA